MEQGSRDITPIVCGFVIFITLGITIANETLSRFGMENNYFIVFLVAFLVAACILVARGRLTVFVVLGVFDINLPEAMLAGSSLDSDLLLGVMCAVILMPAVCELTSS
jgi:hypothetical protein